MPLQVETATTSLIARFNEIRALTEEICKPLLPEDTVVQPMVDVSPPKMAPGAHQLVFRNVYPAKIRCRLRGFSPEVQLSFQLLLQQHWQPGFTRPAGHPVAAQPAGSLPIPGLCK